MSRGQSIPKLVVNRGDGSRSHGYLSSRRVRESSDGVLQRDRSTRDTQAKVGFILSYRKEDMSKLFTVFIKVILCVFTAIKKHENHGKEFNGSTEKR